ncbi:hypothetical protein D3C77_417820 [compost metagenome]
MRADTVGRNLAGMAEALAVKTVDTEYATTGIGGVVLGGIQPFAALVDDRMAIEMPVRLRGDGLQQPAIAQVDQVTLGAGAPGHEQGNRLLGVVDDVVATLVHLGGEHLGAIQAIADGVVLAVAVIAGREQQRAAVFAAKQGPAAQGEGAEQNATEFESLASQHDQSPSLALKPS